MKIRLAKKIWKALDRNLFPNPKDYWVVKWSNTQFCQFYKGAFYDHRIAKVIIIMAKRQVRKKLHQKPLVPQPLNNKNMTNQEIEDRRKSLETHIFNLLYDFKQTTGCSVDDIILCKATYQSLQGTIKNSLAGVIVVIT